MLFLMFFLFCLLNKGVSMEENILGTPVGFFVDFISELQLDFVMVVQDTNHGKVDSLRKT